MADKTHPSLLVVLVAGIGDLVMGSMGLRAIRRGHPSSEIHLLTNSEAALLAKHYPYIDRVWAFPIRRLRHDKAAFLGIGKTIHSLRAYRFEKVVNLYQVASRAGALAMGAMFSLLRSPCKIGHDRLGFGLFLDQKVPGDFFEGRHMADSLLDLASKTGGVPDDRGIEVFCPKGIDVRIGSMVDSGAGKGAVKIIAINAGADSEEKRTDPALFSSAVNKLLTRMPLRTVIFGGPGEVKLAQKIAGEVNGPVLNIAGKTSLEELVWVMERIDLLITNDSGPMHIAAALKKPLVALFTGGDPACFGPYGDPTMFRILEVDRFSSPPGRCSDAGIAAKIASMSKELLSSW